MSTKLDIGTGDHTVGSDEAQDNFVPRRSHRVTDDAVEADGDTWTERLAVCEAKDRKLIIRSYYRNRRTQQRVWDEPPSGASNIVHATPAQRQQAEAQLLELRATLEMIPPDDEAFEPQMESADAEKKGRGLFGRFRKKNKPPVRVDDSRDLNLQRAIARSVADQGGMGSDNSSDQPVVYYDPETENVADMNEEEALAMAKALSMSDAPNNSSSINNMSEEDMIALAIEESRREAVMTEVASIPLDGLTIEHDRKPPAKKYNFDPYAPDTAS